MMSASSNDSLKKAENSKTCLWKKILINPANTTTKDSDPNQIAKCTNCQACPNAPVCVTCQNFLEIAEN